MKVFRRQNIVFKKKHKSVAALRASPDRLVPFLFLNEIWDRHPIRKRLSFENGLVTIPTMADSLPSHDVSPARRIGDVHTFSGRQCLFWVRHGNDLVLCLSIKVGIVLAIAELTSLESERNSTMIPETW